MDWRNYIDMHSSTLDVTSLPPDGPTTISTRSTITPLLTQSTPSSSTSSSNRSDAAGAGGGGELLVAVAALVTEGRIPIAPKHRNNNNNLSSSSTPVKCQQQQQKQQQQQQQQHPRGFFEGPHCYRATAAASVAPGGKGGPSPGSSPGRQQGSGVKEQKHSCSSTDDLCQKYEQVRSEVLNLWQKGIPLCVEVFLKTTCSCDVPLDVGNGSLLLERWYLSVTHFRSSDISGSPTAAQIITPAQLISAIRSQLYFSQISAWLSPSSTPTSSSTIPGSPTPTFHYRLAIPGETFDTTTFTCRANTHTFPATDLGSGLLLNIRLESLPRVGPVVPELKCADCQERDRLEKEVQNDRCERERSLSPGEGGRGGDLLQRVDGGVCKLFDDRMHTRCTLKGKHRCDDLDDFDGCGGLVKSEPLLAGKYKRLCGSDTGGPEKVQQQHPQRSPQRANFSRRLNTTSGCDCQPSSQPTSSRSKCAASDTAATDLHQTPSTASKPSANKYAAHSLRYFYQSFNDIFGESGCNNEVLDGTISSASEEFNQNEKRNSGNEGDDAEESHKAPKLDLDEAKGQFEAIDLKQAKPEVNTTGGDYPMNSILRGCRLQRNDDKEMQSNGNNTAKCDVKCVQRLGRIGSSILIGCARALQTVSDTAPTTSTTHSDIYKLSHSNVNNTIYVDDTIDTRSSSKQGPCRMRDISNTHQAKSTAAKKFQSLEHTPKTQIFNAQLSSIVNQDKLYHLPPPTRRKITFDEPISNKPATITSASDNINPDSRHIGKHPDSPIPKLATHKFQHPLSATVCQKLTFDHFETVPATTTTTTITTTATATSAGASTANDLTANAAIEIPSPLDKAQFRKSLDDAASMVFHARTGLPLTSSPAPVRRGTTCFGYDASIDSVSAIKSALFSGSLSTDDDSESDGSSIVSPCSPDAAYLGHASYYGHALLGKQRQLHEHEVAQVQQQQHAQVQQSQQQVHHGSGSKHRVCAQLNGGGGGATQMAGVVQQQQQQVHHHSTRRRTTSSSHLLGTFEESVLNGRLEPAATVHGFKAELGASGSFVPRHLIVPVTVFFYTFGDSDKVSSPYLGHINLGKKGYNVPRTGTVQVTLFNPLGTVVKMFVILYDLSDMPNNSQTFIRQRTLYMPTNCKDSNLEWGPKWLRYLIHLRFMSSKSGKIYLHSDIRMIIFRKCDLDTATAHGIDMCYELRSFTHMPQNPKYSPRK